MSRNRFLAPIPSSARLVARLACRLASARSIARSLALGLALALPVAPLLASDGAPLASGVVAFDLGGTLSDSAKGVAVQQDGKILVIGSAAGNGNFSSLAVARFLPTGTLDPTFGTNGKVVNPFGDFGYGGFFAAEIVALADGKLLVAGTVESNLGDRDFLVGRLLASGQADLTFGSGALPGASIIAFDVLGNAADDELEAMAVDRSGRILLAGSAEVAVGNRDFAIARLTAGGALDPAFSGDGKTTIAIDPTGTYNDFGRALVLDREGRILVAGSTQVQGGVGYDFGAVRLLASGAPDPAFGSGGRAAIGFDFGGNFNDHAYGLAVQGDGRILVAGRADLTDAAPWVWVVARLTGGSTPDPNLGWLDPTFGFGTGRAIGTFACGESLGCADRDAAYGLALERDGKIVLAGAGWTWNAGAPAHYDANFGVARLLADGLLDVSFGGGDGVRNYDLNRGPGGHGDGAAALALAPDGRLVVAGYSEWNGLDTDFAWLRVDLGLLFADDFESGSLVPWSDAW